MTLINISRKMFKLRSIVVSCLLIKVIIFIIGKVAVAASLLLVLSNCDGTVVNTLEIVHKLLTTLC